MPLNKESHSSNCCLSWMYMYLLIIFVLIDQPTGDTIPEEEQTMNSRLRQTDNHYYNPVKCLGRGATAEVFEGYEMSTGDLRALKVTKSQSETREINREISALVTLQHENIVKMYDIETELESGNVVLVMEHCAGGSLYKFLQEPENCRGLNDKEFRRLLTGLSSGLSRIQQLGFVHRDIKPGNILRALDNFGESIYKLADFGASRQLDSGEGYISLAGTEEYLHPDVHYTAFINPRSGRQFTAKADIWSLGVTLFHAATGETPFRPYLGARQDRDTMNRMLCEKPRGSIRGVQTEANGKIRWSDSLPRGINMSESLAERVTYILKKLIEREANRQWSYTTFFLESDKISNLVEVTCCEPVNGKIYTIYQEPTATLEALKGELQKVTKIPTSKQILMFDGCRLEDSFQTNASLKDYPNFREDAPLVLISAAHNEQPQNDGEQRLTRFSAAFDSSEDANIAFQTCAKVFKLIEKIFHLTILQKVVLETPTKFSRCYKSKMTALEQQIDALEIAFKGRCLRLQSLISSMTTRPWSSSLQEQLKSTITIKTKLEDLFVTVKGTWSEMRNWSTTCVPDYINKESGLCNKCLEMARYKYSKMKDLYQSIKDRHGKNIGSTDEQLFHRADRLRFERLSNEVCGVWNSHCLSCKTRTRKGFLSWKDLFIEKNRKDAELKQQIEDIKQKNLALETNLRTIEKDNSLEEYAARERLDVSLKSIPSLSPEVVQENQQLARQLEELIISLPTATLYTFTD